MDNYSCINNDAFNSVNSIETDINEIIKDSTVVILKFDEENSRYNEFYDKITDYKTVNITDSTIIEFYDIDVLPTIYVYKNKNLLGTIEGFYPKTTILKKINSLLQ